MGTVIDLGYDYEKLTSSLRGFYDGQQYYGAEIVLDHARSHHSGVRKDGRPEFSHQIMQATSLRHMRDAGVMYPEATHIVVLAHDLDEDYEVRSDVTARLVHDGCPVHWTGWNDYARIWPALDLMNKTGKETAAYYEALSLDPIASIAKGLDRDHNLSTMVGAFDRAKMERYITETRTEVFPMLKRARKLFPSQKSIYHGIAHQIRYKLYMAEWYLTVVDG
jgi:hypothetical protein